MLNLALPTDVNPIDDDLERLVHRVAHVLPGQGPIHVFVHHNTLHAFEGLPFEEAVVTAGEQLGCEPYWSEGRYRDQLASGRMTALDVEAVLHRELGDRGKERIAGLIDRAELRRRVLLHGIDSAQGTALEWMLSETDVLAGAGQQRRDVWQACLAAVERSAAEVTAQQRPLRRHRDLLRAITSVDTDRLVHPLLIRFVSAYLDQGMATWVMSDRAHGIYRCFLELYRQRMASCYGAWGSTLRALVREEVEAGRDAVTSLTRSLEDLGVSAAERYEYLCDTALALRGWAGMVHQFETRPDRVPALAFPAKLVDYLAVRLLVERAVLVHAAREHAGYHGPLSALRQALREQVATAAGSTAHERAWQLLQLAELCAWDASAIELLRPEQIAEVERELDEINAIERRRLLHAAYERQLRHRFYDALAQHVPQSVAGDPAVQAIFCLDEREESIRRHLEEVAPQVETFGAPGYYGVAMYYRGATEAHARPLCPGAIQPEHYVEETIESRGLVHQWRRRGRRSLGRIAQGIHLGSRTLVRGTLLTGLLGGLAIVPLVLRVLFPWLGQRLGRAPMLPKPSVKLHLDREPQAPPLGHYSGFSVDEMAAIVRAQLEDIGLTDRFAPLVLVVGHGSSSLNNPHESAHDCGACGGGRGGPSARSLVQMANDPRVRQRLALDGFCLPSSTYFVAGYRNTANSEMDVYEDEGMPAELRPLLARLRGWIETARAREAHERCRRFDAVPAWFPPLAALVHVEGRAADLAQPRPEYGHATNAFCVIGRRSRTRGLFLDRRAFLGSYDPSQDDDGKVLARLLEAVVPVVAGVSLEYYFSYVDPTGYGCGTKLPHNITGLLGVMDGPQSDLRTGLPWQMVEIHEPVRLTLIVECPRERLRRVVEENAEIAQLVHHRWLILACLDPESSALWEIGADGASELYTVEDVTPVVWGSSIAAYHGERGALPFVRLQREQAEREA